MSVVSLTKKFWWNSWTFACGYDLLFWSIQPTMKTKFSDLWYIKLQIACQLVRKANSGLRFFSKCSSKIFTSLQSTWCSCLFVTCFKCATLHCIAKGQCPRIHVDIDAILLYIFVVPSPHVLLRSCSVPKHLKYNYLLE